MGLRIRVATVLVFLAAGASAQEPVAPAKGMFLVATPTIDGGPFFESVVLLLSHGEDGTLGLILNRETRVSLSEALPDLDVEAPSHTLYFGGPVALEGLLVLFRSVVPPENAEAVIEDVHFSGDRDVLETLVKENQQSDEIRIFIGHSGWAPGQLDAELRRGAWDVMPADAFTVFQTKPELLWEHLTMSGRTYACAPRASRVAASSSWSGVTTAPYFSFRAIRPPRCSAYTSKRRGGTSVPLP
jgi:putative transcriptional regulator